MNGCDDLKTALATNEAASNVAVLIFAVFVLGITGAFVWFIFESELKKQ
ncbi:MAG: hypothetical protein LBU09_00570 [Endomicrobium sp.]|jgi:hypothetical protein|nr:hypothetical protein [Endomicrobium sp.]